MGKILVTDSLFIFDEHEQKLNEAGYEVVRLDKPKATEVVTEGEYIVFNHE